MDGDKRLGDVTESSRIMRSRRPVAAALILLGVVSISLLIWTHHINKRGDEYLRLADAIMDLEIFTADLHFRLEEGYHKQIPGKKEEALIELDRTLKLGDAILNGGTSESGSGLVLVEDPELRQRAQSVVALVAEMNTTAKQMSDSSDRDALPKSLEDRFDAICGTLLQNAKSFELRVESMEAKDRLESRRLFYGILLVWGFIVAASLVGLRNREHQRQEAESSLLKANTQLESQTRELIAHREHLVELVEQRTAVLKISNDGLRKEIMERRQAEEALRKSEEQYRMLVETMKEGLAVMNGGGKVTYANENFCTMVGQPRSEILGLPIIDFLSSDKERDVFAEHLQRIQVIDHSHFEVVFRIADRPVFTMVSLKRMMGARGNMTGSLAVITDITEKLNLQAISQQNQNLAYLGQIAAGVAHEINNPINGIINYAQILNDGVCPENRRGEIALRIQTEGRRIATIVKGLLLSARGGNREKVPIALREILSQALGLTSLELKKDDIQVKMEIPPDTPNLVADPQEIQQVFINIISNARLALNEKYPSKDGNKILQIRAETIAIDNSPHLRITLKDNGIGIPRDVLEKVKEPFFSTRPKGKGTGLGLSISNGIVNANGGRLKIESTAGEYTEITIEIPTGES